ncbi:solute carrier family 25 member 45 isoform X3 [Cervus elaphus]|uniref:solute carrier family 25 member 45 isoform X3 n=1 Tax=Cervus elaphus TaxID=9860 RepID=UPI001CC2DAAE|nr:solute carrier family 25 member 45 isoform X3 [Cervus elaphus]
MLGGLGPPGASRHPLKAPDSALPGQRAGREGLDQGLALDSSCEPKGGQSPGVPKLDESADCLGVKSRRVKTLCVWGWLLHSACVSSRQGQARSLCSPHLPCPVPGTEEGARGQLAFLWSLAGALGLVLGHPFDTVKVRLQTQTTYRGIVDCMVKTYRHESLLGFFKGMSFPIASISVVNSVLFGVYSNALLALTATSHQERRAQPPSYTHVFIAGCTGGFLQAYCLAPFDLIKVRLQNQTEPRAKPGSPPPRYRGPIHCAASIFQAEGPRGLFRGAWALTLRDTPTLGIYFVTYEWLCRQFTPDGQNPSSGTVLVAGGFAGIISWVAATPLDVIKSRMQMAGLKQRAYGGLLDCIVSSARQEGLGVFFRGLTINSARAFPVNAITFLSYEYLLLSWG